MLVVIDQPTPKIDRQILFQPFFMIDRHILNIDQLIMKFGQLIFVEKPGSFE